MKILDKLKDLFTDVENDEEKGNFDNIKIEEKTEEKKLPTIMRLEREFEESNKDDDKESLISDRELVRENEKNDAKNFKFPIAFEEKEIQDERIYSRQNVMRVEQEKPKYKEKVVVPKKEDKITLFKASPVISPVYGILDKNYTKEEVHTKQKKAHEINRSSKKVDFESVRKKAFGNLADDIKDNLADVPSKKNDDVFEDNDIEELICNIAENDAQDNTEIKEITLGDAEENYFDFGVAYENAKKGDTKEDPSKEVKIVSYEKEETKVEKVEVAEPILNTSKQDDDFDVPEDESKISKDNLDLGEDIFNLIDNMYQENGDD